MLVAIQKWVVESKREQHRHPDCVFGLLLVSGAGEVDHAPAS